MTDLNFEEIKALHSEEVPTWAELSEYISEEDMDTAAAYQAHKVRDLLIKQWEAAQAKIDALMLEYCPDEMTDEQLKRWGECQVAVPESELNSALK